MQLAAHKIVKEKYFGVAAVFDGFGCLKNIHVQALANKIYRQENRCYQEKCLQTIGNDNGFQSSLKGVRPDEQQTNKHRNRKGNMVAVENKLLQYDNHQV